MELKPPYNSYKNTLNILNSKKFQFMNNGLKNLPVYKMADTFQKKAQS